MGVAGSGKSTLAALVAQRLGRPMLEGDLLHSDANRRKMAEGQALTDADRLGWLARIGARLGEGAGAVASCSALKRAYRDQLRRASPGLRFAFLDIDRDEAGRRVSARSSHFFSSRLVDSQFETLESPLGEPGVLRLDASRPLAELEAELCRWLCQPASE